VTHRSAAAAVVRSKGSVLVRAEEGIDHVFKRQRDQRVRGHGCASPDRQEAGARHEQVIHVLRHSGAEGAIRRIQDAEAI
jgi:hypothetical protein